MAIIYRILGMTCQGCANSVTRAINNVAPDTTVTVDLDAKTVAVEGCDNDEIIAGAVKEAGFEYQGRVA